MALIVNVVDLMEKSPKTTTEDDHIEPYQSAAACEDRVPEFELPKKSKETTPLGGKLIMAPTQTEQEREKEKEKAATKAIPLMRNVFGTGKSGSLLSLLL
jgi:hypothetical protein